MAKNMNNMTDLPTACRFAVLELSDSDEDGFTVVSGNNKNAKTSSNSLSASSAKRKRNKKKRNRSKNTQNGELEELAVPALVEEHPDRSDTPRNTAVENNWEVWQKKDEKFVLDQFQKDLQIALEASKIVSSSKSQPASDQSLNNKKKKKETLSLNAFIGKRIPTESNGHLESIGSLSLFDSNSAKLGWDDVQETPVSGQVDEKPEKIRSKKKKSDKSEGSKQDTSGSKSESKKLVIPASKEESFKAEMVHVHEELSKKDDKVTNLQQTVEKQKTWIGDLQKELVQVKKRNKQLCHILGQGEMKEKAELLIQIEQLSEFREQVVQLHGELEQERSKSSALKHELSKQQGMLTKGRHGSSS